MAFTKWPAIPNDDAEKCVKSSRNFQFGGDSLVFAESKIFVHAHDDAARGHVNRQVFFDRGPPSPAFENWRSSENVVVANQQRRLRNPAFAYYKADKGLFNDGGDAPVIGNRIFNKKLVAIAA